MAEKKAKQKTKRKTRRPSPGSAQAQMHGLWARFEVNFLLDDDRVLELSDNAFRVYVLLTATGLKLRVEVLPVAYDVRNLALRFRKSAEDIKAALVELSAGNDFQAALVSVLEDGRVRVNGLKGKHGNKIRWKDDHVTDDLDSDGVRSAFVSESGYDRMPHTSRLYTEPDLDKDLEPPIIPPPHPTTNDDRSPNNQQQTAEAHTDSSGSSNQPNGASDREAVSSSDRSPERLVFRKLTESWNGHGKPKRLPSELSKAFASDPYMLLGQVLEISRASDVDLPWGVLCHRLEQGHTVKHALVAEAKGLVRTEEGFSPGPLDAGLKGLGDP